jgi:ornithine--oxo-acid transaminase
VQVPLKLDSLGVTADASARAGETLSLAARHLDSSLVDMLAILGFDREYVSAKGSYLYDADGRPYLDMHSGEGFASLGHNHPGVREVLEATLAADLVDGVQIHYSALSGILAEELANRLPRGLDAMFFCSAGAEAVDAAMKFTRAATRRQRFVSCESSFHGVTLGPLSLVGDDFFKEGFGPLLPGCRRVPFGDLDRLEAALRRRDVAAFIVEPVQGRMVTTAPAGYLHGAQELCRRYGTLFVLDEIQTGLGRTGKWFAGEHSGPPALEPDVVLVGKALSGGYMPVAAMATTREIFQRAVGTLERSYIHQSTYGRNRLSMAAGVAAIRIIERDGLVDNAARVGALLTDGLNELRRRYEIVGEVRGTGLMLGIELVAPRDRQARINWRLIHLASEGLFPQLVVIPLHRDHGVITMAAGKNDVIKLLPPLTLSDAEAGRFLDALDSVLADCSGSATRNWRVVRDIATATIRRRLARGDDADVPETMPFRGEPVDPDRGEVCLVTGATGFIGGHLAQRLVAEGYQVRCVVRPSSNTERLERLGVELAIGDLTSVRSLTRAVKGCNYVLHCGALVSDWATTSEIAAINSGGTRDLVGASAAASVRRFVHLSTTDVYGHPGHPSIDESYTATQFANWYAETKLAAEREVRRAGVHRPGLEWVILRPATVYGPGSEEVIGEIARAIRRRNMVLVDRGRAIAGLCYIENLVDAAVLALRHGVAAGEAFNVTDGLDITWKRFTDDLADGLGCPPVRFSMPLWMAESLGTSCETGYRALRRTTRIKTAPLLSRQAVQVLGCDQSFSNRKARDLLGWEPRVGYPEGMRATLDWLEGAGPAAGRQG